MGHSIEAPASYASAASWLSFASYASVGSACSLASIGSFASIASVGSAGSMLSWNSAGSVLSVRSAGSVLSVESAGGVLCYRDQPLTGGRAFGLAATVTVISVVTASLPSIIRATNAAIRARRNH